MGERRRRRDLDPGDHDLWRRITHDVTPLRDDGPNGVPPPPSGPPRPAAPSIRRRLRESTHPITPSAGGGPPLTHGKAPGLDRRTEARMRRGKMPIDARLDLHGRTRDEARPALRRFLHRAQDHGHRCVLVITGRGLRESGRIGVLREFVPLWLNEMRSIVHAFHYAAPQDGGEGALYVLLRRRKPS